MVLIQKPNLRGDVVFVLKMIAAGTVAVVFAVVWYGAIGWAMVWAAMQVARFLF